MAGNGKTFEIGLVMAGAISAGAYSGGVVDFLIEALDEWTKAKADNLPDTPKHDAVITVMTGASAGSITACLIPIAVFAGDKPKPFNPPLVSPPGRTYSDYKAYLPGIYAAWVDKPAFFAASGPTLLGSDDIDRNPDGPTLSLLDCTILDKIAAEAVQPGQGGGPASGARSYFRTDLPVYLTLANLRGVPYSIAFKSTSGTLGSHGMMLHADRAMFRIKGLGSTDAPSKFADPDAATPLDTAWLAISPFSKEWHAFAMTGVASGAFPIGLAPRPIDAVPAGYSARSWPIPAAGLFATPPTAKIEADWPGKQTPATYKFASVDGGTFDNEPLGFARYALMGKPPNGNARDMDLVDRAVVMIDPFPEAPDFAASYQDADATLMGAIGRLLPAFINQSRFKLADLAAALDESVYSRFLVAPKRTNGTVVEDYAIACGLLGGFGGFLANEFRAHDYQLGRRNCQHFLSESFALPINHTIFMNGGQPQRCNGDPLFARIVPLVGNAACEVAPPEWPRVGRDSLLKLTEAAMARANRIVPRLIEIDMKRGWFIRTIFSAWWKWTGRDMLASFIYQTVQGELIRRDQLAPAGAFQPLAQATADQRRVLAAICTTDEEFIGLDEIARRSHIDPPKLTDILNKTPSISPLVLKMMIDGAPHYRISILRSS